MASSFIFLLFSFTKLCYLLSAIPSIESKFTKPLNSIRILEVVTHLSSNGKECILLWIPCQSNILGNEKAHIAVKHATLFPEDEGLPILSLDIRIVIKEIINKALQDRWSTQDTQLNNIKPGIEKWTYPRSLNRRERVITCRLRIGHLHLTHAYLLAGDL
ncbi:hypothetical protein JTB14_025786 [Gonioctena quinquepunctata]|nr:hypothetical protein JTB14_025786 [Gonioctena quinquepunctata]